MSESLTVADKHVVQFHYTLTDTEGKELENSHGHDPIAYLHGSKGILPALAKELTGKSTGDKINVTLESKEAYGERKEDAEQRVPVKHLQGAKKWKKGMMAVVQTEQGQRQVMITKIGKFMATIDTNHPLAGKTLTFDVEVISIRPATDEEIAHGHAHGVGGHQH